MSTKVFTPFRASVLRATRLDGCGVPLDGPKSTLVTDGLISVAWAAEIDEGTSVEVKNAQGRLKVSSPQKPTVKYITATITLTGVDPDLYELLTSQQLVTDGLSNPVGLRGQEFIATDYGVAVETWTDVGTEDGDCGDAGKLYGYFLLPFLVNGTIGDLTLDENAMSCVLMARTKRGSGWGTGPASYLVADSSAIEGTVTPGPLATAIGPTDHFHLQTTPVAPPAVTDGAIALPPV